jgi:TPR repeat protein
MARLPLFLLLWLAASAAAAGTPKADALWQRGDYRAAFAQAFEPALHGDAHAQYLLGEAYRLGRSVDPNFPLAEDWYARAARQGDVAAATELGLLFADQRRYEEALPWLSLAAARGELRAMCSLAALYFNGAGTARDGPLAFALMARAAGAGLPEARARLATLRAALTPDMQARGAALAAGPWAKALPPVAIVRASPPTVRQEVDVRIQVGAFRSAAAAEKAWSLLSQRIEGIRQTDHAIVRAGAFYRLQARLTDAAQAQSFRRRLDAAHWDHLIRSGPPGNGNTQT